MTLTRNTVGFERKAPGEDAAIAEIGAFTHWQDESAVLVDDDEV